MKRLLNIFIALILVSSSTGAWAKRDIEREAHNALAVQPGDLSLADFKARVTNDQLDVAISYERLLQAQKRIAEARAQYFPYGINTLATFYFLNVWNPLLLVELVTSLPSKIYQVQSEKNMRMATRYSHVALKENIKTQVATLYYTMLKEEIGLAMTELEIRNLEELLVVTEERVSLGLSTVDDVNRVELRLLDLRDIALRFQAYLAEEKAAFNLMMGEEPETEFSLAPVAPFLTADSLTVGRDEVVSAAVERAPEIIAAQYRIQAAQRTRASTKWSILSFNGIGFGYWARVQVAGSKVAQARLEKELTISNITSMAYVAYQKYDRAFGHFSNDAVALNATSDFLHAEQASYEAGTTPLDRLIEAEVLYLRDFSEWAVSHYDALIRLDDLSRVYLAPVTNQQSSTVH